MKCPNCYQLMIVIETGDGEKISGCKTKGCIYYILDTLKELAESPKYKEDGKKGAEKSDNF